MKVHRYGNFSSSEIYKLVPMGKRPMTKEELDARPKKGKGSATTLIECSNLFSETGLTYIEEKRMERRLKRGLSNDQHSRPTTWGKVVEPYVFDKLPFDYRLVSKERLSHLKIPSWVGVPDTLSPDVVGDIKCPMTLKSFCKLVDCISSGDYNDLKNQNGAKDDGHKYYWQLVSNSVLARKDVARLDIYVPYRNHLNEIRELAAKNDDERVKAFFIVNATDYEIPYLPKDSDYKDLNTIIFEVPKEDKEFLEHRVIEAEKLLKQ